jgi:transposase
VRKGVFSVVWKGVFPRYGKDFFPSFGKQNFLRTVGKYRAALCILETLRIRRRAQMLRREMMQEIIDLKLRGYSINEIIEHYEGKTGKPPSRPTIRKYFNMDAVPEGIGASLAKEKVFDAEPWRSYIIDVLANNPKECYSSSVYDVLVEKFVEGDGHEGLPGSERTLRNYIKHLIESGQVEKAQQDGRTYDYVFDTPPGQQMLIDFGELRIKKGLAIHFICMLLRYSRMMCVFAQDHKYNSEEACRAIYHGFCKLGGRPGELVIDQDSVFVSSEYIGEIIEAHVFRSFVNEQGLKLWVCNKNDPQSKGPVENLVGFVKKNFFSARDIQDIDDVWKSLPGWVERKNRRIHQATYRVPKEVFGEFEKEALMPMLPSVYDTAVSGFLPVNVGGLQYIQYKSSKYSVPRKFCFKTVHYKAIGDKLHIYGPDLVFECSHDLNPCKGSKNRLPEHLKEENTDWLPVVERLRSRWNCYKFQHFVNGFKKENHRHLFKQLSAVEAFLEAEDPPRDLVAAVMAECCEKLRYRFTQFKAVYDRAMAQQAPVAAMPIDEVQRASLERYQVAFLERCGAQCEN